MAHRVIIQVAIVGVRIFSRAFIEATKQLQASQKYAASGAKGGSAASTFASSGLTLEEACKILNVAPPKGGKADMEHMMERFKKLYDINEPGNGGSFYLQSKVLRARERIEMEVGEAASKAEAEKAAKDGWKPKVYKDR